MWEKGWRVKTWSELDQEWDILIIGGGITGAGVFRRSVAEGFRTLLIEAGDFASGTSSRSSKLVHGGFRYLRNKQFDVTRESVREREWLLKEARHLVTPLGFLMPCPANPKVSGQFAIGVIIYDLLAPKWKHSFLSRARMLQECQHLSSVGLRGGFLYYDAAVDDARMVLRMISEAVADGGTAINYARAKRLLRTSDGSVCGALVGDCSESSASEYEVTAKVVINATGPWSDELREEVGAPARLRKLRGSHLVFPRNRLPLPHAVTLLHPLDHRAMFAIPWEGVSLIGTTDLDHSTPLSKGEPFCSPQEIMYILQAGQATFPAANLKQEDIISTFAGLRPVINTGIADPSKESRAHVVWEEEGLITITGGKLTTFRIMAEQALQKALPRLHASTDLGRPKRYFNQIKESFHKGSNPPDNYAYLLGRYGRDLDALLSTATLGENESIDNLQALWSEIKWAARTGAVEHLDDLLLRRVRLGILLPDGASGVMERVRTIAQPELGWNDARWESEEARYQSIYKAYYSPEPNGILEY